VEEFNFMFTPTRYGRFEQELEWLESAYNEALEDHGLESSSVVLSRFFCSDLPNQIDSLRKRAFSHPDSSHKGSVSVVNQPPPAPAKVCMWVYCIKDPNLPNQCTNNGKDCVLKRDGLEHIWTTGYINLETKDPYRQTRGVFASYLKTLGNKEMTLEHNVIRTWFFVKDIDSHYWGLVQGRNDVFDEHGLTADTHYIASTGIEGSHIDVHAKVLMDAYAIKGVKKEQIEFLHALDHLSHTHKYGVSFERATSVAYRDRKHVFISGTASIDKEGKIVHVGDVIRQFDRALENIDALLNQAKAEMKDMQHFVVYVRDPSDAHIVHVLMKERVGEQPFVVVTAPVCRPGWLVEIEGIAIVPHEDDSLPDF
jgi:enamine deaminase RidA (YjgF/YER057c/UK114 family)